MNAGGIIGRIVRGAEDEPAAISEYLQFDDAKPVWTRKRDEAFRFASYTVADRRARELHAFALVTPAPVHRTDREDQTNVHEVAPLVAAPVPTAPAATTVAADKPRRRAFDRMETLRRVASRNERKAVTAAAGSTGRLWWKEKEAYS